MAMKKRRAHPTTASKKAESVKAKEPRRDAADGQSLGSRSAELFSRAACQVSHWAGKPIVFLSAVLLVLIWALSGPLFGFSDTWQLVINTSTTIVTFLMVFLIQHTQNRDTLALQLKLAELIITLRGAENGLATAEDLSEEELERLHDEYRNRAEDTLEHLNRRRGQLKRAS
jgi:low affinity Fe/Cu permease